MQFKKIEPPRIFKVGADESKIELSHVMDVLLDLDEQITLKSKNGGEFDICRKSWGYYATPSINYRLKRFGYKTCLVESSGRRYVHLVEQDQIEIYLKYLIDQGMKIIIWLDEDEIKVENNKGEIA
jgi:hypothetical protein